MQSNPNQPQPFGQGLSQSASPSEPNIKSEHPQDAAQLFLAAQQRFDSRSPLSASASADQPGSGYQSSSAQSASGDPNPEGSQPSTSNPGSRRPSSLGRKPSEGNRSQKHRWSAEETQALVDGCNKHGVGNWKKILSDPELSAFFSERTAGDLKDRFRTYFPDAYHEMYPNAKTHLSKAVRGRDSEGKSIFEKGKTKERRPFTPEEDAALRAGYQQYGSHWALIAKNPIFNGQRRAIDLRDRFRNAFPEDYERAGFKPRPSKARKDRGPSAAKPSEGHAANSGPSTGTFSDHSASEGAWRSSEYPLSDATSDGHLTDHGNLTDYSYFTDQGNLTDHGNLTDSGAEQFLSGPSSASNSLLGRSNSMGNNLPRQTSAQAAQNEFRSFGQMLALQQQQQQQASAQSRPPFLSSNTAPLHGAGLPLRSSDMVTGQNINSLFEQLKQASLEGPSTSSETSSIQERPTPPSASESDLANQQQFQQLHQHQSTLHSKAALADDARRQAGKQVIHDGVSHKRRSHATRTGKNSALERLPSVHGHLHHIHQGSAQAHSRSSPHSQSSSQHDSPAGGAVPVQTDSRLSPLVNPDPSQLDVLAWLGPAAQPLDTNSMDIDDQRAAAQGLSSWTSYPSGAGDFTGTGFNASDSANYFGNSQFSSGAGFNLAGQSGFTSPPHPGSNAMMIPGMGGASDSSASSATGSRRSSAAVSSFDQQRQLETGAAKAFGDQQNGLPGNFMVDSMQNFLNPPTANSADPSQWNMDWDLGSISDSGLQNEDVNALLASLPLSHHPWAGDLHHGATASASGELDTSFPDTSSRQIPSAQGNGPDQLGTSDGLSGDGYLGQGQGPDQVALPQQQQQQQVLADSELKDGQDANHVGAGTGISFATVTYGDPLVRDEREGSPDSLELNREQTFTAKDVGTRFVRDDKDDESDDDQRRRSTDTLRHVEGALEQALESVEDTRALQFAQQFHRDDDSDEDSDEDAEADEDGYEEDEEDDDEPEYEPDGIGSEYNFQQVLDDLQASDAQLGTGGEISSDFFDGPFNGATPGAPGIDTDGNDLSLYPELGRSQQDGQGQIRAPAAAGSTNSQAQTGQAAAIASMNQMWNSGMPLDQLQQLYMGSDMNNGSSNAFATMQNAGWTSSPGDNPSPNQGNGNARQQ